MFMHALKRVLRFLGREIILRTVAPPIRRKLNQFEAATLDPKAVQEALLSDLLRHQAATGFGRDHHFSSVRTVEDYRRNVAVAGYEAIAPYVDRVKSGETNALLADPKIHMFALTSGTTATRKYIPVTERYLSDYKRSWNIWGLKVFRDHKDLLLRPIVQLAGDHQESYTPAGVPCGAVTGLTAQMQKRIVRHFYCVPPGIGRVKDSHSKYYVIMRLALPRSVAMFVAANPSTMINLARLGDQQKEALIRDVRDGTLKADLDLPDDVRKAVLGRIRKDPARAKELDAIASREGRLYPKDAWTKPFLLGNWTGGSMGAYLRHYPKYFGEAIVRDVGLIASEGRMTIPFDDNTPAGVLDITSHYFEFVPEAEIDSPQPTVLGAHELTEGGRYYILLTTAYGLYRYNIHDVVRCAGFLNRTPRLEFLSKGSLFANVTGEKVSEYHVTGAMVKALHDLDLTLSVYGLAPCWPEREDEQPYYGLFVERGDLGDEAAGRRLAARLDEELSRANVEYEAKRTSGRLGPVRLELVRAGFWAAWDRERLRKTGGTLEQYKHPCLIGDHSFAEQVRQAEKLAEAG